MTGSAFDVMVNVRNGLNKLISNPKRGKDISPLRNIWFHLALIKLFSLSEATTLGKEKILNSKLEECCSTKCMDPSSLDKAF